MAFPLAALSTGISLFGGIEGLLGGDTAQRQAQQAAQQAITQFQAAGEKQYSDALGGGLRGLYGLTGRLNDALTSSGRSLGAADAGAGVYNSSVTAGQLSNEQEVNAQNIAGFQGNIADQLAQIKNSTNQSAAEMQLGLATGDTNYARQRLAGSEGGIGQALSTLGQLNFGTAGGTPAPMMAGTSANGGTSSVLPNPYMTSGQVTPPTNQYGWNFNPYGAWR